MKLKRKIFYTLEFIIFIIIYYFFKMLPVNVASNLNGMIFKSFGPLTKTNFTILKNLNKINKFNKNVNEISKMSWKNLGCTVAEMAHLNSINKNNLVSVKGKKNLKKIIGKSEQAIFIAIHQSNWEILAPTLIKFGIKLNSVYRHINNPFIDKFILKIRKKAYNSKKSLLSPKGKKSAQDMIKSIKNGYSIALLIDQKDSSGENIPLFGKLAKTQIGFIKLAIKFKLKIYPIENIRLKNAKFKMIIHDPINLNKSNLKNQKSSMIKIHKLIESWIIKEPGNWLWHHKRWG